VSYVLSAFPAVDWLCGIQPDGANPPANRATLDRFSGRPGVATSTPHPTRQSPVGVTGHSPSNIARTCPLDRVNACSRNIDLDCGWQTPENYRVVPAAAETTACSDLPPTTSGVSPSPLTSRQQLRTFLLYKSLFTEENGGAQKHSSENISTNKAKTATKSMTAVDTWNYIPPPPGNHHSSANLIIS